MIDPNAKIHVLSTKIKTMHLYFVGLHYPLSGHLKDAMKFDLFNYNLKLEVNRIQRLLNSNKHGYHFNVLHFDTCNNDEIVRAARIIRAEIKLKDKRKAYLADKRLKESVARHNANKWKLDDLI